MCLFPPGKITFNLTYCINCAGRKSPWILIEADIGYFVTFVNQLMSSGLVLKEEFPDVYVGAYSSSHSPLLLRRLVYFSGWRASLYS